MNNYECYLHGAVNDAQWKAFLMSKLKGLSTSYAVPFHYKELVFKSAVQGIAQIELRARCDLSSEPHKWTVRSTSLPNVKPKMPVLVRSVIDAQVSDNIHTFLELAGYKYDYEFVSEGTESIALIKDRRCVITVSKIFRTFDGSGRNDEDSLTPGFSLVELTTTATTDEDLNHAADELNLIAEYFAPISLVKIQHTQIKASKASAQPIKQTLAQGKKKG
ncbi:mediator of RNA polymerase II transcription subunit 18-like [Planoprotostelium fungivorum]|uniref:Mediator of RNA polymerase II transcription subunit 18 n=1 Tax=Planoprotostelium fungivorum TaxID=1890364 RepID=A0A2P6NGB0_9EUKA|nr:mediator of RNA polymerase II transcription subunit 18-like [Planoprotostelium fungivorum]